MVVHQGNIGPPRHRNQVRTAHPPSDANLIEHAAEHADNVGRFVAEEVSRVGVGLVAPPDRIERAASVGVDQPAQQFPRVIGDEVSLPLLEDDRSLVFSARPVLRKQTRPVIPVRGQLGATDPLDGHHRVTTD